MTGATTGRKGPPKSSLTPAAPICRWVSGAWHVLARHHAHRQPAQTAQREVEHPGGGSIQPLKIIDSKHDRTPRRRHPQPRQGGRTNGPAIKRTARLLQQQHDRKSMPLLLAERAATRLPPEPEDSARAANPSSASASTGCADSTTAEAARARSWSLPPATPFVLPMPGSPARTTAAGPSGQLRQQCGHVPELPDPA